MNTKQMTTVMVGLALLGTGLVSAQHSTAAHADGLAYGPDTCINGYVWRQANPTDHVCVLPTIRDQAAADNAAADDRFARNHLPYGPDTCVSGYVWRGATSTDHVCVTPDVRDQAAADNAQATARVNPSGGAYGADTCLDGYVWRDAFTNDHVCVLPTIRDQAAADNAAADDRFARNHLPYGLDTCVSGYVWRGAFTNDDVCVLPSVRDQATADNAAADSRYARNQQPHIWLTDWTQAPVCSGGVCSTTSTDDIPRFKVNGDHFTTNGNVYIAFTKISTGVRTNHYVVAAPFHTGYVLGSFGKQTGFFDCNSSTGTGYYVQAYDYSTRTWSNRLTATVCTAVL